MATSTIVDIHGNPFELELKTPQTDSEAQLAPLHQHYPSHPSSGLTPARVAAILSQAEHNDLVAQCELAEDFEEKDGHIFSELSKRRRAVLGYHWKIVPPPDASAAEKDDAAMIESVLRQSVWLEDALFDMTDCILKGFSALELQWHRFGKQWLPVSADQRPSAWFQSDPNQRNALRLRDGSYEGMALRPFGWISHCARAKSGYLGRQGLVRVLAWPFIFKNYSVRDLAEFLEIYGLPIRLGKYPGGATETEKATLLRAVMSIGHNAGGIIPQGMSIDFEKAVNTASADTFMAMITWCERTQSKAILGGTLTSQADGKSSTNALGNVHNEVRKELTESDARQLARTVTRDLIYPIYALNGRSYQGPQRLPRFEFDFTEAADITALAGALPGLVSAGVRIPLHWVNQELQIPEPKDGEAVLGQSATESPELASASLKGGLETAVNTPLNAGLTALENAALESQQRLDSALAQIDPQTMQALLQPMLQPLFAAIERDGPEAAMEQLAERFPEMDDTALTEQLGRVLFVAQTWGHLNAGR